MKNNNGGRVVKKDYPKQYGETNCDSENEEELYIDSSDEKRLKGMSEKQRQKILYERHSKLMAYKEQKEVDKKLSELERSKVSVKEPEQNDKKQKLPEFTLKDFSSCVFTRDFLLKNVHRSLFENFIGHFVKVKIRDSYHVARIENIEKSEVYSVKIGRSEIKTNKILDLATGTNKFRKINIQFVSNLPINEDEFELFKAETQDFDLRKHEHELKALKKSIQSSLEESPAGLRSEKQRFIGERKKNTLLKIELIRKREKALEMKKYEQVEAFQAQIDSLTKTESYEQDVWAAISERNRKINAKAARLKSEKPEQDIDRDDQLNPCKRKRTRSSYE